MGADTTSPGQRLPAGLPGELATPDNPLRFRGHSCRVHAIAVGEVFPIPGLGDVFADLRGDGRTLRVSCHSDRGAVVLSLWAGQVCRGSFRLGAKDLDRLLSTLKEMGATLRAAGTVGEPTARQPAVDEPAAAEEPPAAEQTGDVAGTADMARSPIAPRLRVA
jgi:hypothetical protein